jgi:anti-sigma regulatory factor (Ser/Thr protein kinase)
MSKATADFPRGAASVTAVRRFVKQTLDDVAPEALDAIVLMSSEVATNVVRHAGSEYRVEVRRKRRIVEVRVTDHGGGQPVRRSPSKSEPTGRGIVIVDALSDSWGTDVDAKRGTTTFWFRVDLSSVRPG